MSAYRYFKSDVNVHKGRLGELSQSAAEDCFQKENELSIGRFVGGELDWAANVKAGSNGYVFAKFYETGRPVRGYSWYAHGQVMQLRGFSTWSYESPSSTHWKTKVWACFGEDGNGTLWRVIAGKGTVGDQPWSIDSSKFKVPMPSFNQWGAFDALDHLSKIELGMI